jgi:tetratricopeptide (TPR) repeat protein
MKYSLVRHIRKAFPALALPLVAGCAGMFGNSTFEKLPEASVQTSSIMEEQGDITLAVEELKIALTIDPDNKKAQGELKRLLEKRNFEAEKRFKAGMALRDKDPARAAKEYLAALRIRSDYPEAVAELKNLQLESSEATIQARADNKAAIAAKAKAMEEDDDEATYLETAIAFYEDGDYTSAIKELQEAKGRYPNDPEIHRYLNLSWYHSGIIWFKKKDYRKALDAFGRVKKGFESVDDYTRQSRQALKGSAEDLYKMGLKFFREQKLSEAIGKWQAALEIEPQHQKAREYIEKARKLQEALRKQR